MFHPLLSLSSFTKLGGWFRLLDLAEEKLDHESPVSCLECQYDALVQGWSTDVVLAGRNMADAKFMRMRWGVVKKHHDVAYLYFQCWVDFTAPGVEYFWHHPCLFVGFIADWQVFFSDVFEAAGLVSFSPVALHANITVSLSFALLPPLQEMSLVLRVLSGRAL